MAAHVVTAMSWIMEHGESHNAINGALQLSCWTEDLDLDDYASLTAVSLLDDATFPLALRGWTMAMLPKYRDQYFRFGCPETREEWHKAKYSH